MRQGKYVFVFMFLIVYYALCHSKSFMTYVKGKIDLECFTEADVMCNSSKFPNVKKVLDIHFIQS